MPTPAPPIDPSASTPTPRLPPIDPVCKNPACPEGDLTDADKFAYYQTLGPRMITPQASPPVSLYCKICAASFNCYQDAPYPLPDPPPPPPPPQPPMPNHPPMGQPRCPIYVSATVTATATVP